MFFTKKKAHLLNDFSKDFPALNQVIQGKPPIYFDNACVSLRPQIVIDEIQKYYSQHPACAHRSVHKFGSQTTKAVEHARKRIATFIGAKKDCEIIFTRNTTESISIIAQGLNWQKGDKVITSNLEHNSNTLPWMSLVQSTGINYLKWDIDPEGQYDLENLYSILETGSIKLLSLLSSSHVLGLRLPIEKIINKAHQHGTLVLIDAAQSLLHEKINVTEWGADFLAISFHKSLGPSGLGCLYINENHFEKIYPSRLGGETVVNVTDKTFQMSAPPYCYESGLQDYAGNMGAAKACDYIDSLGYDFIKTKEHGLNKKMLEMLNGIQDINLLGYKDPKNTEVIYSIFNFYLGDMDTGELSILLDKNANIMTRSGAHCCHSWFNQYRLEPSIRISLAFYNSPDEIDIFGEVLKDIAKYYK